MLETSKSLTVGIFLFPEVEVLDFAGPYEVFCIAARIAPQALKLEHAPFEIITIAARPGPVTARHGLRVLPDHCFSDAPPLDILIVPGGIIAEPLANPATLDWLRHQAAHVCLIASVCTGAFLLGRIGLLDGLTATTHWEDVDDMRRMFPGVTVLEGVEYVDEGAIATSGGISAGISMSLHLVARMIEPELARLTARQMQYEWPRARPTASPL